MKNLIVIDGNSIINRAYYGVRPLSTKSGIPTNAIYGFMNIMLKYIEDYNPDYLCVAFDLKAPTFRHKMYDAYKAQRKGMPDELAEQLPHLKDILSAMNILQLSLEGYEADDIIGTISRLCEENSIKCNIVTGDKDDLQLAGTLTNVLLTTTRMGQTSTEVFDDNKVIEKYGVTPLEFISVKALMGDSSDNIPGVKGIGEKTAFELMAAFHSLDNLYENIESELIKKSAREKLISGRDDAYLCHRLCKIDRFVPVDFDFEKALYKEFDNKKLIEKLTELELRKIIERLHLSGEDNAADIPKETEADESIIAKCKKEDSFYFLLDNETLHFTLDNNPYFAAASSLKNVLENENIKKYLHGYKSTRRLLDNIGINLRGDFFDSEILAYVIDPSKSEYDITELFLQNSLIPSVSSLPALCQKQLNIIKENNQESLVFDIEFPLENVLYEMENAGFKIDRDELCSFSKMLGERIAALENSIYFMAGGKFNINSLPWPG